MSEKFKGINISQLLEAAQTMFNNKEPIERLDLLCKLKATVTSDDRLTDTWQNFMLCSLSEYLLAESFALNQKIWLDY